MIYDHFKYIFVIYRIYYIHKERFFYFKKYSINEKKKNYNMTFLYIYNIIKYLFQSELLCRTDDFNLQYKKNAQCKVFLNIGMFGHNQRM